MTCRELRAAKLRAMMLSMGIKSAEHMDDDEACRVYSRLQRGARNRQSERLPLQVLVAKSTHNRRARQTHPGKR